MTNNGQILLKYLIIYKKWFWLPQFEICSIVASSTFQYWIIILFLKFHVENIVFQKKL
jgi:hypothetical protein